MRIVIGYPSLDDPRGFVQVGQNRQSKIFSVGEEAAIFPCVMAWAATLLKQDGHEVIWQDGPAEGITWLEQRARLRQLQPDLILWEAKTPSIKRTWTCIKHLKEWLPSTKIVLCGDHVTALPEETLANSPTDIVLTGGDYDFGIVNIVKALEQQTLETQSEWIAYAH